MINLKNLAIITGIIVIVILASGANKGGNHVYILGQDEDKMISVNLYDENKKPIQGNSFSIINYAGTGNKDVPGVYYIDFTTRLDLAAQSSSLSCQITNAQPAVLYSTPSSAESLIPSKKENAAWTSSLLSTSQFESFNTIRFNVTVTCSGAGFSPVIKTGYIDILIEPEMNPNYCYQENAISSVSGDGNCGLTYTGIYGYAGTWTSRNLVYDDSWTTAGYGGSTPGIVFINYTKPAGVSELSLWKVKDGKNTRYLMIPSSCWNYDSTKLVFNVTSVSSLSQRAMCGSWTRCYGVEWVCQAPTVGGQVQWVSLLKDISSSDSAYKNVYEEGMMWDYTTTNLGQHVRFRTDSLTYDYSGLIGSIAYNSGTCGNQLTKYGSANSVTSGTGPGTYSVIFSTLPGSIGTGGCGISNANLRMYYAGDSEADCVLIGGYVTDPGSCIQSDWRAYKYCEHHNDIGTVSILPHQVFPTNEVTCT